MKSTAVPDPQAQKAFIEKGIRSKEEAERTGEYFDIGTVMEELASDAGVREAQGCGTNREKIDLLIPLRATAIAPDLLQAMITPAQSRPYRTPIC